ncbi:MAG: hypothetical protein ACRDJI_11665 [Actinomycetota bacterium]
MRTPSLVAASLAGALLASISVADAAPGSCAAMDRIGLRTYHIEAKPDAKQYAIGDVAKVKVTVTRPADEDPAGQGQPTPRPTSEPAEGVRVGMSGWVKRTYFYGFGALTDAEGKTTVKMKIPNYTKPGWAYVEAGAERFVVFVPPCWNVYEEGYAEWPRFFKVE